VISIALRGFFSLKLLDMLDVRGVELRRVKIAFRQILRPRSMLAIALMFWCAGAGCMMVSYARSAMTGMDAPAQSAAQPMAGMSGSMDAHACCKARHKSSKQSTDAVAKASGLELVQTALPPSSSTDVMSCCPLTSGSIVIASRSQSTDDNSVLNHTGSSSLQLTKTKSPPLAVPLRPPNRACAYLLDCAFLI
jgi:hypothetical protein